MSETTTAEHESTGRLAAFSDGVIAIALTLLVLNLKIPDAGHTRHGLARYLGQQWPSYLAYLASFLVIGTIWLNHHATFRLVRRADHRMQLANLFLLLTVSVIPFPTALLAEYASGQHSTADRRVAVLVYGVTSSLMALGFNLVWRRLLSVPGLLVAGVSRERLVTRSRRYNLGLPAYPVATLLGLLSLPLFLGLLLALALLYLLPTPDLVSADENMLYSRP